MHYSQTKVSALAMGVAFSALIFPMSSIAGVTQSWHAVGATTVIDFTNSGPEEYSCTASWGNANHATNVPGYGSDTNAPSHGTGTVLLQGYGTQHVSTYVAAINITYSCQFTVGELARQQAAKGAATMEQQQKQAQQAQQQRSQQQSQQQQQAQQQQQMQEQQRQRQAEQDKQQRDADYARMQQQAQIQQQQAALQRQQQRLQQQQKEQQTQQLIQGTVAPMVQDWAKAMDQRQADQQKEMDELAEQYKKQQAKDAANAARAAQEVKDKAAINRKDESLNPFR